MEYGEIIELGPHRLMCGDATKRDDVERLIDGDSVDLVLTDPPYGMRGKAQHADGRVGRSRKFPAHYYPLIIGDENQDTARKHYEIIKDFTDKLIIWGGQYFAHFLPINGGWIFWDKRNGKTDFSDGELAWKSWGNKLMRYEHLWNGLYRKGNTLLNGRTRVHPTQKPVELHMNILQDFSEPGDIVLDCFGGSGTTLIACEQVGRRCFMMELSPEYCGIIIERYMKVTQQAKLFKEE